MRDYKVPVTLHAVMDIHVTPMNVADAAMLVPGYAPVANICLFAECGVSRGVKLRVIPVSIFGMNGIAGVLTLIDGR
jgi:hypothetical protein